MTDNEARARELATRLFGDVWRSSDLKTIKSALDAAYERGKAAGQNEARDERRHSNVVELQEIADGAYGDNPAIRGAARDRRTALEADTPANRGEG